MKAARGRGRSDGALLIELVITLLMFTVGVFGLASAMVSAQRSQDWSRERLLASRALASQLEVIGETPFDNIKATYDGKTLTTTTPSGYKSQGSVPNITAAVTTIDTRLLGVTLTATWTDSTGTRSLTLYQEFGK
jgi:Tfp pilus assembly protein PilV